VCSTRNLELVRSLGADAVLDYTVDKPEAQTARYDILFDCVGKLGRSPWRQLRQRASKVVSVTGQAKHTQAHLLHILQIAEEGKLTPVIDRTYTLAQIQDAHRYVEQFRKRGNVAVQVA
jgi:NADPH:quinone reductase-like Zn-dependent oxidoreductase